MATFRYGDVVMDVVDQKDHEAVIRAADSAQRRHEKEIRGMLRLDIADACNNADLRILNRIHQDLGLKPPSELLSKRQKTRKPLNKLKVFVGVIRAVARMRVGAQKWAQHEKTRQRLVAAWEEQKQKQKQEVVY
ncbi:Pericentrin-AKAP-450 domain of centrosomal targeting protein-domain-containing protein [Xylaria grammica]|nr:Pericentrin-AKAP-450 domain of centrosomal targeting protein-domain-containing protein [Xylaria grammica]